MADELFSDIVKPFDPSKALGSQFGKPVVGESNDFFSRGTFDPTANTLLNNDYNTAFNALNPDQQRRAKGKSLTVGFRRANETSGNSQIPGLNYGIDASPGSDFEDITNQRLDVFGQTNQNFNQMQQQTFNGKNLLNELPANGMGKFALIQRLNDEFGPGWNSNEQAMNLYRNFESQLSQGADIQTLNKYQEQGKNVSDYIRDPGHGVQFFELIKMGDEILREVGFSGGSSQLLNQGKTYKPSDPGAFNRFAAGGNL